MPHQFGEFTYLHGDALHVRCCKHDWLTRGHLPWFLTPLRPQGFLGRELARSQPSFPGDPEQWSLEQTLHFACTRLEDALGAVELDSGIGQLTPKSPQPAELRGQDFDQRAQAIGQSLPWGSSAGGEQPKFITSIQGLWYIVKFTPPKGTPFGERWHHLFQLEKLALETLENNGIAAAHTEILQTTKRSYLQSQRFDRTNTFSTRHIVAAAAIHDEFLKTPRLHWIATCEALVKQNLLSASDARTVALSFLFGKFIGNTDMHFGNLSFFVDDVVKPKFIPTPVYDMLPMMWRPDIHHGNLDPSPLREPIIPAGYAAEATVARGWAIGYWQQASANTELNTELRELCLENARRLEHGFQ
jgi:hypothetical protein